MFLEGDFNSRQITFNAAKVIHLAYLSYLRLVTKIYRVSKNVYTSWSFLTKGFRQLEPTISEDFVIAGLQIDVRYDPEIVGNEKLWNHKQQSTFQEDS